MRTPALQPKGGKTEPTLEREGQRRGQMKTEEQRQRRKRTQGGKRQVNRHFRGNRRRVTVLHTVRQKRKLKNQKTVRRKMKNPSLRQGPSRHDQERREDHEKVSGCCVTALPTTTRPQNRATGLKAKGETRKK